MPADASLLLLLINTCVPGLICVPAGEEMVLTFDMQLEECLQPKYRGLQVRLASK